MTEEQLAGGLNFAVKDLLLQIYSLFSELCLARMSEGKFCLRWKDYESSLGPTFFTMRADQAFSDVTLARPGLKWWPGGGAGDRG